jgi:hypothetical protein
LSEWRRFYPNWKVCHPGMTVYYVIPACFWPGSSDIFIQREKWMPA